MRAALATFALTALIVGSSLLAGIYIDLIVHKVSSWNEIVDAFSVHVDFARPEKWRGYFIDQEPTGEWKVHQEVMDLTSFLRSNRVIGTSSDAENPPPWAVTGYVKSDSKYLIYNGADMGVGFYLLAARGRLKTKPKFSDTFFAGFRFGKNEDLQRNIQFMKCPYVLIREGDIIKNQISESDVSEYLTPEICINLSFPDLTPQ